MNSSNASTISSNSLLEDFKIQYTLNQLLELRKYASAPHGLKVDQLWTLCDDAVQKPVARASKETVSPMNYMVYEPRTDMTYYVMDNPYQKHTIFQNIRW